MSGYIGNTPTPQATQTRDAFTATAGQTTFATSGYTPGYLDVYLNGVHLNTSDFTATNGSDVVLTTGAALNDELVVIAWTTFEAANIPDNSIGADELNVSGNGTSGQYLISDGDGSFSWNTLSVSSDAITEGNSSVEVVDTGSGYIIATTDGTERMRIDASGNVGIGTTSPDFPLEVYKDTTAEVVIGSNNGGTAQLSFYENDSTNKEFFVKYDGLGNNGVIGTSGNSTAMVIARDTGRVGINTSSPTSPLHVYGGHNGLSAIIVDDTGVGGGRKWGIRPGLPGVNNGYLTIHDETANATRLVVDDSGNFRFNSGYGSAATAYGVRAWVNFDGTGTVSIRDSGNVSSITDNGPGIYTLNFSTSLVDANYAIGGAASHTDHQLSILAIDGTSKVKTTSACKIRLRKNANSTEDASDVSVILLR